MSDISAALSSVDPSKVTVDDAGRVVINDPALAAAVEAAQGLSPRDINSGCNRGCSRTA